MIADEYFLFQWFKSQGIAVFMVQVPDPVRKHVAVLFLVPLSD